LQWGLWEQSDHFVPHVIGNCFLEQLVFPHKCDLIFIHSVFVFINFLCNFFCEFCFLSLHNNSTFNSCSHNDALPSSLFILGTCPLMLAVDMAVATVAVMVVVMVVLAVVPAFVLAFMNVVVVVVLVLEEVVEEVVEEVFSSFLHAFPFPQEDEVLPHQLPDHFHLVVETVAMGKRISHQRREFSEPKPMADAGV